MSRTDKTRPYWVQLRDPLFPYGLRAFHHHYGAHWKAATECDLSVVLPVTRRRTNYRCRLWPRYGDNDKVFGRSNWRRNHPGHDGRARASLRQLRAAWLKIPRGHWEDIDSMQDAPTQRWLWRSWYWD